jgi:hypothetical protein
VAVLSLADPAVVIRLLFSSISLINYKGSSKSNESYQLKKLSSLSEKGPKVDEPLLNPLIIEADLIIPKVVVFLTNCILINGGLKKEGIFRKSVGKVCLYPIWGYREKKKKKKKKMVNGEVF